MSMLLEEALLLLGTFAYLIILSFSVVEKRPQRRLLAIVLFGLAISLFPILLVGTVLVLTRYDTAPLWMFTLLLAPIVEELMKFISIFFLARFLQGCVSKYELIRFGGAVGLGFSCIETLTYIGGGLNLPTTIWRLAATSPLHVSACFLTTTVLTERKYLLLLAAILLHSFSNYLSKFAVPLQALLGLGAFFFIYYFSETDYRELRGISGKLNNAFHKKFKRVGGN